MESKEVWLKHPYLFHAGQTPQPEPRADEGLFTWISKPDKHIGWDRVTSEPEPRPFIHQLCMVVGRNDVRLMGLKSVGQVQELMPGLGINTTLTLNLPRSRMGTLRF